MAEVNVRTATVEIRTVKLSAKLFKQVRVLSGYTDVVAIFGTVDEMQKHILGWITGAACGHDEWHNFYLLAKDGDIFLTYAPSEGIKKYKQIYV